MHIYTRPSLIFIATLSLAFSACSGETIRAEATTGTASTETASTNQAPKGGGDRRLQKDLADPAAEGELALNVETLADGLVNPWGLAFLPDGDILVTERAGRIRVIRDGSLVDAPVANTPDTLAWNQGGYFDILPHPDFATNRTLYFSFANGTKDANALRVIKATLDGAAFSNIETIYDVKPLKDTGHHYGGRMAFGGDGKLYITSGEGSRYKEKSQDMSSSFGAVVRLNLDGSIPDDNPSFGEGSLPELFSKGHRNPQGLAYDAERGILWSNEHGARGGDEVNVISAGANYGWPLATYGIDYNGARISPFTEYEGTTQPVKYWTPSIAPSGMAVYRGEAFSAWDGDLLVGAMAGRALHRIIMDGDTPAGEERYLVGERIRDVRVGPDGAIYVTTEDRRGAPEGKVLRLTPAS